MKNLCFFIDSMCGGGLERAVLHFSNAVVEFSHDIHIVILENKISYE
jgi:hypothetical protein